MTVTLISPNESSDQLELLTELKVISDDQQTKTVVESDNSYDIIGIQITSESLGKKTWYENHSTNYMNPIPLSVDISIEKSPSVNIDEVSEANKKNNISILKTKITHTDFRELKDISSSSNIKRLTNIEDCYFTINSKNMIKEVGEYIISVAVKNSLHIELFQRNFYIYVHGVNVTNLEFFKKIFDVRLDTPKIEPIRVQLSDECYSPILTEKRLSLKIIDKDFELEKVNKEEEDRIVENINIVNGEANNNLETKIYRFCDEQDHENLWIKWKYNNISNNKLSTQPLEKDIKFVMTINDDSKEGISNQHVLYQTIPFRIFGAIPSRFKISEQENFIVTILGQPIPTFKLDCYDCYDNHVTPMIHENWEINIELKNNQLPIDQNNELPSLIIREELLKLISKELNQIPHDGFLLFANKIINCKYEGGRLGSKGVTIELSLRIIDLPNFIPLELTFFVRIDPEKEMIGRIEVTYGTENQIFEHSKSNLQFKTNDIIRNIKLNVFNKRNEAIKIDEDMTVTCNWGAYESHQFSDISLDKSKESYLEGNLLVNDFNTFKFEVSVNCNMYSEIFKFSFDILIRPIIPSKWDVSFENILLIIRKKESWDEVFKNGFKIKSNENSDYLNSINNEDVEPQLFAHYSSQKAIRKLSIPLKYSEQFNRFEINMDEFTSFSKILGQALVDFTLIEFKITATSLSIPIPDFEFSIQPSFELSKPLRIFLEAKGFNLRCTIDAEITVQRFTNIQDLFIIVKDFYDDNVDSSKLNNVEFSIIKDLKSIRKYKQNKISVPVEYVDIDFSTVIDGSVDTIDVSYIITGRYCAWNSQSFINMENGNLKVRIKPNNVPKSFIFWEDSSMLKQDDNIEMINRSGVDNDKMEEINFKARSSITCDDNQFPYLYMQIETEDGRSIPITNLSDSFIIQLSFYARENMTLNKYSLISIDLDYKDYYELQYLKSQNSLDYIQFSPKILTKKLEPGYYLLKCVIRDKRRELNFLQLARKQLSLTLSTAIKAGHCVKLVPYNQTLDFLSNPTEISNAVLELKNINFALLDKFNNIITEDDCNIWVNCSLVDSFGEQVSKDLALINRTADGIIQSKYSPEFGHCFAKTILLEYLNSNDQLENDQQFKLNFTGSSNSSISYVSSTFKFLTLESLNTEILLRKTKLEELDQILACYERKEIEINQTKFTLQNNHILYSTLLEDDSFKFYTDSMKNYFTGENKSSSSSCLLNDIHKSHISKVDSVPDCKYSISASQQDYRVVVQAYFKEHSIEFNPNFVYELIFIRPEFKLYKEVKFHLFVPLFYCLDII